MSRLLHARTRRGVVLVWVVVAMVLLMAAIYAAYVAGERARNSIELDLQYNGQALNIARAGVADAHSWYRRQPAQPVTVFAPRRECLDCTTCGCGACGLGQCGHCTRPVVNDTDDPDSIPSPLPPSARSTSTGTSRSTRSDRSTGPAS